MPARRGAPNVRLKTIMHVGSLWVIYRREIACAGMEAKTSSIAISTVTFGRSETAPLEYTGCAKTDEQDGSWFVFIHKMLKFLKQYRAHLFQVPFSQSEFAQMSTNHKPNHRYKLRVS